MSRKITRVAATLQNGMTKLSVFLNVTTVSLQDGEHAIDEAVAEVALASRDVPDGDYVLEYSLFGAFRAPVRVKYGTLIAAT